MTAELRSERRDTTLVLTISDPGSRNALSPQVSSAAIEVLGASESDDSVRAVVLVGEGAHFCSGARLQGLQANRQEGAEAQARQMGLFHQFIEALRTHPKPVIAAVEGAASGAGFAIALACDLIVAAEDARFSMAYTRLGLSPDGGASWHLMQSVPRALALQWLWLGDTLSTRQLESHGLVNRVTDGGHALAEAVALAERLAQGAPNALASIKELVNQARGVPLVDQLGRESRHFAENLFHANAGEGLQAYFEKRPPRFR